MNISKSKIVVVPETNMSYEVRIDLVKAKYLPDGRLGWLGVNGVQHIAGEGTKINEGRYIVLIQNEKGTFPPSKLNHAGSPHLCTQSRNAALSLYNAWVEWAQRVAQDQDNGNLQVRMLPSHSYH